MLRRNVSGFVSIIAAAALAFFMEPLIPLGDWRWLAIAGACLAVGWWLSRSDRTSRSLSEQNYAPSARGEQSDSWRQVSEYAAMWVFIAMPMLFMFAMLFLVRLAFGE